MKKRCRDESKSPRCVIWDIDDTLIVIRASVRLFGGAERSLQQEVARLAEDYLLSFLEKEFYFSQTAALGTVESLRDWEMLPIEEEKGGTWSAHEYATFLRRKYTESRPDIHTERDHTDSDDSNPIGHSSDSEHNSAVSCATSTSSLIPRDWHLVLEAMEEATDNWTKKAREVLLHLKTKNCRNVVVTSSELAPAMAKLILWGLSEFFSADDIYSSATKSKKEVFQRVIEDLKKQGQCPESICACGDGLDEERASRYLDIPFKRIGCAQDLLAIPGLVDGELALEESRSTPSDEVHSLYNVHCEVERKKLIKRVRTNLMRYSSSSVSNSVSAGGVDEEKATTGSPGHPLEIQKVHKSLPEDPVSL